MQDFVTDRTEHLLRRLLQKQEGLKKKDIFRAAECHSRRSPEGQVQLFAHLEKEVTEEIVFVFHEGQAEMADKREKGILQ